MSITAILLSGFAAVVVQSKKISRANMQELAATLSLREAIEAAKDLEQSNWAAFATPGCLSPLRCHPVAGARAWTFANGSETPDDGIFTRSLTIEAVNRNVVTHAIDPLGIPDLNTKKVSATMSWVSQSGPRVLTLETYVYQMP